MINAVMNQATLDRRSRDLRHPLLAVAVLVLAASGCSSAPDLIRGPVDSYGPLPTQADHPGTSAVGPSTPASETATSTTASTTTTTVQVNEPPQIFGSADVVSTVGVAVEQRFRVADPEGGEVQLTMPEAPDGVTILVDSQGVDLRWQPIEAGRWSFDLVVEDDQRSRSGFTVHLSARNPSSDLIVSMGDSVAAGHGRDLRDYLGDDDCWRDEQAAYGAIVTQELIEVGELAESAGHAIVACSGFSTQNLDNILITPGPAGIPNPEGRPNRSQLEWAATLNPRFVLLSIGANDLRFIAPWQLIGEDGALDQVALDAVLAQYEALLSDAVGRVLDTTDAILVVTNFYDPSAADPQGFGACRGPCFKSAVNAALDQANTVIAQVVAEAAEGRGDRDRVRLADIRTAFVDHGAPNGLGPDFWRADGFGALGEQLGAEELAGVHPYCARGGTQGTSWISRVDCVHPNDQGQRAIAEVVLAALVGD